MHSSTGLGNLAENKNEVMGHNMDLFSPGMVEKSMSGGYEQELHPSTAIDDYGPYEFNIPPTGEYTYLPQTRLLVQGKFTKNDGSALAEGAGATEYSITNLFPQTLFRQVDVLIGGVNTSSQDLLYPYKAYFETLFSYSDNAKNGHLFSCSGFSEDDIAKQDVIGGAGEDANVGYTIRKQLLTNNEFEFCIPLHADVMKSPRFIPPNTSIKIILARNNDAFSMMTNSNDLKIKISSLKMYIRKVLPTENIRKMYAGLWDKKPVIIPFSRSILKRETIATGSTNKQLILFNGHLPRQILIGFIDSRRVDGRGTLSPFHFNHFNINHVNLRVNGLSEPCRPYQPDFAKRQIARELRALYDNTGVLTGDAGFAISRSQFLNGMTFFAWDTTPDRCNGFHIHDRKIGKTVDLDVHFSEPLTHSVNIIVYATYETDIKLLNGEVVEANFVNG